MTKQFKSPFVQDHFSGILMDVDSTLTNSDGEISERTKKALGHLASVNIPFGVCTGRSFAMLKPFILTLFPTSNLHVVSGGGQIIFSNGKEVFCNYISSKKIEKILHLANILKLEYCISQGDSTYCSANTASKLKNNSWKFDVQEGTSKLKTDHVTIVALFGVTETIINQICRERDLEFQIIRKTSGFDIDITNKNINKLIGAKFWAKNYNTRVDQIAFVGDSNNDMSLMKKVGLGIAMGNATEDIKRIAKTTIDYTDNDGLAKFIESISAS